jgi:tetratricopeptide (TPR) repeat protein
MLSDPHAKSTKEFRAELEEAARVFEELGDDAALATVWRMNAEIEWMPCRYERAEREARKAVECARRTGDPRLLREAFITLIFAQLYGTARPQDGLRTLASVIEEVSHSRELDSFAPYVRGFYAGLEGSIDEARRLIGVAIEIGETTGLRALTAVYYEELAFVELSAGEAAAAEHASRRTYEILDDLGDEGHKSTAAAGLAMTLCALDRFDEAERYAAEARRVAAEDDLISQVLGRAAQATVLASRNELADAERLARQALEMFADAEAPLNQGDVWMTLAQILLLADRTAEAEQAARQALALYERKGNVPATASTRAFIEAAR